MLSEEKINVNYLQYISKLQHYNCYSEEMINDIGDRLKTAPYSKTTIDGGCYDGGLIDVTLFTLCRNGVILNNQFKEQTPHMYVNNDMLVRTLLLLGISKSVMFEKETDAWKIRKGELYRFSEDGKVFLTRGERSVFMCNKYGIHLEEDEFAAILISDSNDESLKRTYVSPLCAIVNATINLTRTSLRVDAMLKNSNGSTI